MKMLIEILKNNSEKCYNNQYNYLNVRTFNHLEVNRMDVKDLAIGVISYFNNNNLRISNLKLQKILYYIQGYVIKETHEPAFNAEIYNWQYGPVVEEVYFEYNQFRGDDIVLKEDDRRNDFLRKGNEINNVIINVLKGCKNKTAFELVEMTHREAPWKNTHQNELIKLDVINEYFSDNDPLKIEKEAKCATG